MQKSEDNYYVPASSIWPIVGAIALFLIALGAATTVRLSTEEGDNSGIPVLLTGITLLLFTLFNWFKNVINESMRGLYSRQLSRSFRQGMQWFIFSEVMFFIALFAVLFYLRTLSVPWLGGAGNNQMTHDILWADFIPKWPLTVTPDGQQMLAMEWHGLPLLNTLILITSSITLHFAHHNLQHDRRKRLTTWLTLTVILGSFFIFFQAEEYIHAYRELALRFDSGVYGNTFFLLTGFHGLHVSLGVIMLTVMLFRVINGHFSAREHFAFEASAWYWHFVDVVWIILFIFVYIV